MFRDSQKIIIIPLNIRLFENLTLTLNIKNFENETKLSFK